ncbi:DnaJ domain-containing protein [Kickxella alabastrina]|uniref:DnaJ domain-containing protein n=1 Tax=Kickxella alabastrina TaxID=61397 RepID=UPI002220BB40|nr:DnaJ domain-containing protein [Kickxella alabastrina]KAI7826431.1 DnaJ domain-containing protein [Kickxella alabastrina]
MDSDIDVYALLGVTAEAGDKELTKAYRIKALLHHPDKNRDDPNAAKFFHDIKSAYDLLNNPKQRAEYDEKRKAQLAKRQRQDALSAREIERKREHDVNREAARFREESQREEQRHDRKMREHIRQMNEDAKRTDETLAELNESLAGLFSIFGDIEEVVVAPTSYHGKKKDPSMSSALLVFKSITSAHALMNTQHQSSQLRGFLRFWATGAEPQAVRNITANTSVFAAQSTTTQADKHGSGSGFSAGAGSIRLPDVASIDMRDVSGSSLAFADFESLTLMRMRQHGISRS